MIKHQHHLHESRIFVSGPAVLGPEGESRIYTTFLEMRKLLEEYPPSWYSDALRERADSLLRDMGKY